MLNRLLDRRCVLRIDSSRGPPTHQRKKKTKGPWPATRIATPWRQGTEHGSHSILLPPTTTVKSGLGLRETRQES